MARKNTQLSMAKLTALAGDDSETRAQQLAMVDQEMCLGAAQEQLPTQVLGQFGFGMENMRVLSPREMIELERRMWKLIILSLRKLWIC